MTDRPVRIAGAGVAGLTAAIWLAQRGVRVEVHDRARDSGASHPPRYDAIENWTTRADLGDQLRDWHLDLPLRRFPTFEVHDYDGDAYPASLDRPLFYVVRRGPEPGSLEQRLKQQALDFGVRLRYGVMLPREQVDVLAIGAHGRGRFVAASLSFRTSHPDAVRVIVDERLSPGAYAYLIVVDGQGTISTVLTEQFPDARSLLEDTVRAFQRIRPFEMADARLGGGTGGMVAAFHGSHVAPIVVGEAAGFQDYLWGFGIRLALRSGVLAAETIVGGADYERSVAREIRPLVRSSLGLRMLYDHVGNRGSRALIRRVSAMPDPARLLYRCYRGPVVGRALWPLARLQLRTGTAHA